MLPWMLFSETLQRSASSLVEQANLITKTVFPAEIVPVSIFFSALVGHALALLLLIVVGRGLAEPDQRFPAAAAGLRPRDRADGRGFGVDRRQPARLPAGHGAGAERDSDVLVLGHPHFSARELLSGARVDTAICWRPTRWRTWCGAIAPCSSSSAAPSAADLGIALAFGAAVFVAGGLFFRHMKRGFADVL